MLQKSKDELVGKNIECHRYAEVVVVVARLEYECKAAEPRENEVHLLQPNEMLLDNSGSLNCWNT